MAKSKSKNVESTPVAKVTKAEAPEKVTKVSKYRGLKTGMRVMEFQDHTLAINDRKDRRRTDEELQAEWRGEFPDAVAFTLDHVRGVRSLYNAGKHTKASVVPETPSLPYVIRDGKRVTTEYTRVRKGASKAPKAETKATVATPTVKVRKRQAKDATPVAKAS